MTTCKDQWLTGQWEKTLFHNVVKKKSRKFFVEDGKRGTQSCPQGFEKNQSNNNIA